MHASLDVAKGNGNVNFICCGGLHFSILSPAIDLVDSKLAIISHFQCSLCQWKKKHESVQEVLNI